MPRKNHGRRQPAPQRSNKTRGPREAGATAIVASKLDLLVPNATVFVASACIMVIELVAGRIIARHLGSSLYTWTSVIGIVLTGLAIGNYVGGRMADRFPVKRTLAALFVAASAASALISVSNNVVGGLSVLWSLPWQARVASHVTLVFFLPACLMGMIGPVVAKMALDLGHKTGETIGSVYAWGALGSIVGTFLTGFFLIAWFGTTAIVWGVAGVLAAMAILYRVRSWKTWTWAAVVAAFFTLATGSAEAARSWGETLALREPRADNVLYRHESQYSYIDVIQVTKDPDVRHMHLNTLLHSKINLDQPSELHYGYERIFAALTARLHPDGQGVDSLTIGGGGYVFPRYLETEYPGGRTDVVEIDPTVTEAATMSFGLSEKTAIHSYHQDGRVFVDRLLQQQRDGKPVSDYDLVYLDAFDDYHVPYQLTTVEFAGNVRELLKPGGAYLVNMIDTLESGRFLDAMVNTLQDVFSHVYVFTEGIAPSLSRESQKTFVVAGMDHPIDTTNLGAEYAFDCQIYVVSDEERLRLAGAVDQLVLTDEYAPVENLLAAVVRTTSLEKSVGDWLGGIQLARLEGDYNRAITIGRDALAVFPNDPHLLTELGGALRSSGEVVKAMAELRHALRLEPTHVRARLGLIDCYRDLGRIEESLSHYQAILDHHPLIRYNYGGVLLELGRERQAIVEYKKVIQLRPSFADAYNNCGVALHRLGDDSAAVEQFKLALEHDPDLSDARSSLKSLLASAGSDK